MASASSSTAQVAIPVNSHPLLADDLPSRGRRTRPVSRQDHGDAHPSATDATNVQTPNYFTLKERLDAKTQAGSRHGHANWDGSVRGYAKVGRVHNGRDTSATRQPLPTAWDGPPTFVVGSSKDHPPASSASHTAELVDIDGLPAGTASRILANQWHDYSDEAIQSAISAISDSDSPASVSSHPYHTALRVLSSAVHNLTKIRREMEESFRVIQEKEHARKQRAEELMKELQSSDRDIARRVMQSLFTDDDEGMHKVERNQSHLVSIPSYDTCQMMNVFHSPSPTLYPRRWSTVLSSPVPRNFMNLTWRPPPLPRSSSLQHRTQRGPLVLAWPRALFRSKIMMQPTQAAFILNSARAHLASKVPNLIALRLVIGWGLGGQSLDTSTSALPFLPMWIKLQYPTHSPLRSLLTAILQYHRQRPSPVGAKFRTKSLARWDSLFSTRCP
jgi:hypothetical protein